VKLKLNGIHQLLANGDDLNILGDNTDNKNDQFNEDEMGGTCSRIGGEEERI
jgi:hypothetical protein